MGDKLNRNKIKKKVKKTHAKGETIFHAIFLFFFFFPASHKTFVPDEAIETIEVGK
jgi:hypothetical protein